jgi:hypothetical protein
MNEPDPQLVRQLKMYKAGAHVHTVNKAQCYYTYAKSTPTRRAILDAKIRAALVNHDWAPLRIYMGRWF